MQNLTSKIAAILISMLMIISIGASTTLLQDAHGAVNLVTFGYINIAPDPCGVGQSVTVDFWLAVPLQDSEKAVNMTVHITDPAGTKSTLGPFISDFSGGTYIIYTPTQLGNYSFYMTYGGQTLTVAGFFNGDYEEPCTSPSVTLTVQSTSVGSVSNTPLPTQYWQTPVNAENVNNWYALTGPWLGFAAVPFATTGQYNDSGDYNPYTTAPTSAHILWTKPWYIGGVAGGELGGNEISSSFWGTSQYSPKYAPIIMDGREYATWYTTTTSSMQGIICINLYNGQTEWLINTTDTLRCGEQAFYENPSAYGVAGPYLWTTGILPASQTGGTLIPNSGTQWNQYDAMTGQYIGSIVNGTSPTFLGEDQWGDLIGYVVNNTAGTQIVQGVPVTTTGPSLELWNATLADPLPAGALNNIHLWRTGLEWQVQSIPTTINGVTISPSLTSGGLTMGDWAGNAIYLSSESAGGLTTAGETSGWLIAAGFSATTGALLWGPVNRTETPWTRLSENFVQTAGDGVYVDLNQATDLMNAYSLYTGDLVWTNTLTTTNGSPVNTYDEYGIQNVVDSTTGVIFFWGLGGDVWAVNMTSGAIIWWTDTTILSGSSGTETPYGIWPLWVFATGTVAGGILFVAEGHEYDPPLFHGAQQLAINITNGQLVWSNLGFDVGAQAIAYGIFTTYNAYDGQIYGYGQGPSATTVTAPDVGVTTATPIVISGTVMDVSPGASQEAVAANFPNGLPCVSDASMSQWMEYVYEQQPHPTNTTGVPVTLTAIDPNNNFVTLGTTTSDASGYYTMTWTPPIPGNYTISATFEGTGAYYGSYAETSVYAGSPPPTAAPTATPLSGLASQSSLTLGIVAAVIAIIIAIAIVGILLLRKKP